MRRRSRRHAHADEHVGHERWLVSYADFITLLFAFFVVLFASAYKDSQEVRRVAQAIHAGFQQMGAFDKGNNLPPPPPSMGEHDGTAASAVDIEELRRQLQAAIGQEIKNHEVELRVTPEGFVISLREMGFFNSGQAILLPGAGDKIKRIANVLLQHGLVIRVEGNSDNQPIHNAQFRSNWELSTARAMAVLLLLVDDSGFDPKNISVAGYGEYRPIADNSTPEGRKQNRRVDLVVVASVAKASAAAAAMTQPPPAGAAPAPTEKKTLIQRLASSFKK
jgi:chemotaxis protein MotB